MGYVGYPLVKSPIFSKTNNYNWIYWLPALIWAALIFCLSHQSRLPALGYGVSDSMVHLGEYFIFSLTLVWGSTSGFKRAMGTQESGLILLIAVLYGFSDEYHQSFILGRNSTIEDVVADGLGALMGVFGSWFVLSRFFR